MNIVFWSIIIILLVLLWFCLSFIFKSVGKIGLNLYKDAKKEILDEEEREKNEE